MIPALKLLILALMALLVFWVSFFKPRTCIFAFIFVLMAFNDYVGGLPSSVFEIGGHLFYFADFLIVLFIGAFFRLVIYKELKQKIDQRVFLVMLAFTLFGVMSFVLGLSHQHFLKDIIGDFRRYFYYIWAIFIPVLFFKSDKDLRIIEKIAFAVAPVICLFAIYRIITGQTYFPAVHEYEFDYFRAMGFHDYLILIFVMCIALGKLIYQKEKSGLLIKLYVFILPVFVILSNFRIAWILLLLCPLMVLFLFRSQEIDLRPLVKIGSISLVAVFAVLLTARATGMNAYEEVEGRFVSEVMNFSFQETRRNYLWDQVFSEMKTSPFIGFGSGKQVVFMERSFDGDWYWKRAGSIHNSYLEFGLKFGLIGLILFLFLQYTIIKKSLDKFKSEDRYKPFIAATIAYMVAALIQTGIQPFLAEPNSIVLIYLIVGTVLSLSSTKSEEESEELQSQGHQSG
jgi:O-antigen ligase